MKRGYPESPSGSVGPPQSRLKQNPEGALPLCLVAGKVLEKAEKLEIETFLSLFPDIDFWVLEYLLRKQTTEEIEIWVFGVILFCFVVLGDSQFLEDESTKIFARKVAEHYSARTNQTLEEREASPIIHLKKLNNWIKSVLIQLYARRGDAVLDLACGKALLTCIIALQLLNLMRHHHKYLVVTLSLRVNCQPPRVLLLC
ncbi:mrna cap guanine-n7 methyltransferase 1 [Quercus suber]|uniref:mRNA (guanine-N(7))-methyltransferase n=1 Tax=Quercus suber TaxID=58331 RepID=A0AAW0MA78_QUESU